MVFFYGFLVWRCSAFIALFCCCRGVGMSYPAVAYIATHLPPLFILAVVHN